MLAVPSRGVARPYFDLIIVGLAILQAGLLHLLAGASAPELSRWALLSAGVAVVPALFMLPLGSADAYFYAALGRAWAVLGANPFAIPINSLQAEDVILRSPWVHHGHMTSQYGPLGLLLFGLPWLAGASSLVGAVYFLKGLVAAALLALAGCLRRWFAGTRYWWVLLALLNPFFISQLLLDGHKEAFILLPFLLGLGFLAQQRGWLHGLCNAAVASISIYYLVYQLVLHFALLVSPRHIRTYGPTLGRSWLLQALLLLPAYTFWHGADLRGVLAASAQDHPGSGALMLALRLVGHFAGFVLGVPGTTWSDWLKPISFVATALLLLALVGWVRRRYDEEAQPEAEFLLVTFGVSQVLWLASWYYQPWYAVPGLAAFVVWCGLTGTSRAAVCVLGAGLILGALHSWCHWAYFVGLCVCAVATAGWIRRGAARARP